jgi:hypothetical protein
MAILLGGASMRVAAKARRQFAMPCGFARIATMGDGDASCSMAVRCPQNMRTLGENRFMVQNALLERR